MQNSTRGPGQVQKQHFGTALLHTQLLEECLSRVLSRVVNAVFCLDNLKNFETRARASGH